MADYTEIYTCENGRQVSIEIDDDTYTARVYDQARRELGRFEFDERDEGLKLVWAYLDLVDQKYKRQGIGRRLLTIVRERYGLPIITEDNDGIQRDDGSHLTGDAPTFVSRMRNEGLIEHSALSRPSDDDK